MNMLMLEGFLTIGLDGSTGVWDELMSTSEIAGEATG